MAETLVSPLLIGRQREMEALERALRAAQGGSGRCVLLSGEPGIGKSRLAAELSYLASGTNFTILRGYCSEQDTSFPYAPWIDALRTFLAPKNAAEARDLLGVYAAELVKLLPELTVLLPSLLPSPALDPAAEKHRLFETLVRFFASLTEPHRLLIVLEDLHWSDEQSLEFLHYLVRRINHLPILILGTYRGEDTSQPLAHHLSELNRQHLVEEIRLTPLTPPEVGQMVQAMLNLDRPLRRDWLDLLVPLTEGNPFFVEEITKSLSQSGSHPGQWDPRSIPTGLQHNILKRMDGLHDTARRILCVAAVIGERFDFALLQDITAENEPSLLQALKELIEAQLIVELSADQFTFRHALTRQVVYASLLFHERKTFHKTIGETIERFGSAEAEAPIAPLAYHFYQAGDWQKAMEYSLRAGEMAQALYAPREALAHFSHALEAARQLNISPPLLALHGQAQMRSVLGDFDGARQDFETIIELAHHSQDRLSLWQGLMALGYAWQPRDLARAGEYFQQALQQARAMDDASILGQSLNRLGNWYFFRGRPLESLQLHREALEIFQANSDRRGLAVTLELLGMANYGLGDVIKGTAYYEQAIPLLREIDDRQGLVRALEFLSMRARLDTEVLGQVVVSQLASFSEKAYEIAHSFDWLEGEGEALSRAGICWSRAGEFARALELLQRAQSLGEEINHRHLLTSVHLITGELYLGLLALSQARQHLEQAFELAQEVGALQLLQSVQPLLVRTCILQADLPRAKSVVELLSITNDLAKIERAGIFERACWSAQAELELGSGHAGRALEIVDRLIGSAPNLGEYGPHAIPWLSRIRAQALTDLGRLEEAVVEYIGAQTTARAHGELPLVWQLNASLGHVYRSLGRRADADLEFHAARLIINDLALHAPDKALRENFLHSALVMIPAEHVPTSRQAAKKEFGGLTARQREIATLIAQGKSNREIANTLVISEKTAERHVANILWKLGFNARSQIAAWAVARGLDK